MVTIPTAPEYPSLNLAQAVMVVAYELMMAGTAAVQTAGAPEFVAASISDPMLERLAEALVSIGFIPDDNPEHIMLAIRDIFGRKRIDRTRGRDSQRDGAADAMGRRRGASHSRREAPRRQEIEIAVSTHGPDTR